MGFEKFASETPPSIEIFSDLKPEITAIGNTSKVSVGGEQVSTIYLEPRLKDSRLKEVYGSNEGAIVYRGSLGKNGEFIPQGKVPYEELPFLTERDIASIFGEGDKYMAVVGGNALEHIIVGRGTADWRFGEFRIDEAYEGTVPELLYRACQAIANSPK